MPSHTLKGWRLSLSYISSLELRNPWRTPCVCARARPVIRFPEHPPGKRNDLPSGVRMVGSEEELQLQSGLDPLRLLNSAKDQHVSDSAKKTTAPDAL